MIPKIIHYCWFGKNDKSPLIESCIESWRKYLPDYKIIEWNEDNFDVNINAFTSEAYSLKKWAFVSDYARLQALYDYGGIYFDTDVEVLKSFDEFLVYKAFMGFESRDFTSTAVIGAEKGNKIIKAIKDRYDSMRFVDENGIMNDLPNPYAFREELRRRGFKGNGRLQNIDGCRIFPEIYFSPNNLSRIWNKVSDKSYAIHHFDQSWRMDDKRDSGNCIRRIRRYSVGVIKNIIGTENAWNLKKNINRIIKRK